MSGPHETAPGARSQSALRRVARLVGVEALKLRRGRLFRFGLLATAAATLLAALTQESLPHETGWSVAARTSGTGFFVAEVFLLVLGATAISGESTGGTLKMILPHAYRRSDWVVAKATVLVGAAVLFALVATAASLGHAALAHGLSDVTKESAPMFGEASGAVQVFQAAGTMASHLSDTALLGLGALVATTLLGVLLSCLFSGVVPSLCAAFLLFGLLASADLVLGLSREANAWIYAWYPGQLREATEKLGRGLNERWDAALLATGLWRCLATGAGALLAGALAFSRRDLQ